MMQVSTSPRYLRGAIVVIVGALGIGGCATQNDVRVLSGRISYLENRVNRTEDLATEASGTARKQVLQSRQELTDKLDKVQAQVANLLAVQQQLQNQLQQQLGQLTELQQTTGQLQTKLSRDEERIAAIESAGNIRAQTATGSTMPNPADFQWANEHDGYAAARKSYVSGNLQRAKDQFLELLRRWPKGTYAPNAHFWLGEIYYRDGDYINAIDRYLKVIEHFPKSNKAPGSYYKMALSLERLGEKAKAYDTLRDLIKLYPSSEEVKPARAELKKLKKK